MVHKMGKCGPDDFSRIRGNLKVLAGGTKGGHSRWHGER